ncbi:MAG: MtrB/PioB family decaheme-associated outer membrane protein [Xanthomonadales bacterium]|nr:MtrB/PioB family decaheme-associated outer membrane protein [Xanthomonadales bacterium]
MRRLFTLLIMLYPLAVGHAAQPAHWRCDFCSYASGWTGETYAGPTWLSAAPSSWADNRGVDDDGLRLDGGTALRYRGGSGTWFDLFASDLGTERRRIEALGGREGRFRLHFRYRELARHRGHDARSPFVSQGADRLVLPQGWITGPTTGQLPGLASALQPTALKTHRRDFLAGLELQLPRSWKLDAEYHHLEKRGTRPFGAGIFTLHAVQVPAPTHFNNDRAELSLSWSGHQQSLRIGLVSSVFNNAFAALTVENPFSPIGNARAIRAALEPDSSFRQISISGTARFGPRLRFAGSASFGNIEQDGTLLPYSINPDFEGLPLPNQRLDQQIDSRALRVNGALTARISPRLTFRAKVRTDERDNNTPISLWTPVVTDLVPRPETPNRPYSFERRLTAAELTYRAAADLRFSGGLERREHERTLQAVRQTGDTRWWGELAYQGWNTAQLRLRHEKSDRDTSPYETIHDPGLQENPLMRKFNLADRARDRTRLSLDLAPGRAWSAALHFEQSDSRYRRSALGLRDSEDRSWHLDASWAPSRDMSIGLFAGRERIESNIVGAESETPWTARSEDRFTTWGAHASARISPEWTLDLAFISLRSRGSIETRTGAGEPSFPDLENRLRNLRLSASYRPDGPWGWTLRAEQEHYRSRDWQLDGLGATGIPVILTLGGDSPDHDITQLVLEGHYRF